MKTYNKCDHHNHRARHLTFGLLVVVAGVFLILKNIGILSPFTSSIIFSWQMLLIAIGIIYLVGHKRIPGIILIIIGAVYMAPMFYNLPVNFFQVFWPSLLILGGILIIFSRGHRYVHKHSYTIMNDGEGFNDFVFVFSGAERIITSQNYKGGSIVTVFGGAKIDFTNAILADGVNYLEIVCAFGGVELIIPSDWNVKIDVTLALGGFVDKRVMNNTVVNTDKTLIIKGVAAFGGGEIKSSKK